MKKTIMLFTVLFTVSTMVSKISYGQANTSLSNLTSPTAVNANLLPKTNNVQNLGSAAKSWHTLFLDSSIYMKDSMFIHTHGTRNMFMGENAGISTQTSGGDNIGLGFNSLRVNTSGFQNIGLGSFTLYKSTTGYSNTAIGYSVLSSNTAGHENTGLGSFALFVNTTGQANTSLGSASLGNNTKGDENTATGWFSMYKNTTGSENTANGSNSLTGLTIGNNNTAIGQSTLATLTTHSNNTAVGWFAGWSYYGNNNTFIGSGAVTNAYNYSNSSALGYQALFTASNQVRIGNSSVTSIGGQVSWSTLSDGRAKKNIKQNVPGLAFINKLNPVTYNLDLNALDAITKPQSLKDAKGNVLAPSQEDINAREDKEKVVYTGLIAQDVETAAKETGYNFSGVDAAKNEKDLYGLRYSDFVMPLIKSVQELSKQNSDLEFANEDLEKKYEAQQKEIDELKAMIAGNKSVVSDELSVSNIMLSSANTQQATSLSQNIPNPFSHTTTINYTLPQEFTTGQIIITDKLGKTIKTINVSGSGKGTLTVDASALASGSYNYSLYIDGKLIDSKRMVFVK